MGKIVEVKQPEYQKEYQKRMDLLLQTMDDIYTAWDRAGFQGDPMINLTNALAGVAVYRQLVKRDR